ncbi:GTP pyrophosphokinase [Paenibacillus assamensis]|uniref:GTP pyrophosphokinase n=1 Tax=Paenibacillus assamensis TaxID=311244 RepID=UPI00040351B5|nr:RelA/SpoT domain-containing protein [Paenibacillus assamensis]
MSLIEKFLKSYSKEYDFYLKLAQICAMQCENVLEGSGIRAIVTYRAKRPDRLKEKLEKRIIEKRYKTVESIYKDIVDLAGVRIAIYFPGDREVIDNFIENNFLVHSKKEFPGEAKPSYDKRFSGYWAYHYRVSLKSELVADSNKRYTDVIVEIQVASVLMHAWSEVEHDLVYKPLSGELSIEEYQILDELNGLVLAGEIALERLQNAAKIRVTGTGKEFNNHYELSSYLYDSMKSHIKKGDYEPIMGRADVLYKFLQNVELNSPEKLSQFTNDLDPDTENRPVVDQIIDRILLGNEEYYKFYNKAKNEIGTRNPYSTKNEKASFLLDTKAALGFFLSRWIVFESLLGNISNHQFSGTITAFERINPGFNFRRLESMEIFDQASLFEIQSIRRLRNEVVHGISKHPDSVLINAGNTLEAVLEYTVRNVPEEYKDIINEAISQMKKT